MRVCLSIRPSSRSSVGPALFSKVKSTHTRRISCRVSGLVFSSHNFLWNIVPLSKSHQWLPRSSCFPERKLKTEGKLLVWPHAATRWQETQRQGLKNKMTNKVGQGRTSTRVTYLTCFMMKDIFSTPTMNTDVRGTSYMTTFTKVFVEDGDEVSASIDTDVRRTGRYSYMMALSKVLANDDM